MHAMYLMLAVLLVLAIAYRYYSAFIAAKVLALDDSRQTPAYTLNDGQNYHPTNKWVLFGHHFAAISGAGPLLGPVLAAQFGYLPGLLWILIGVCLAGAVQDFVVLTLSIRRGGKSLAQLAYEEIGKVSGGAATVGILFVLVIALAGLGKAVVKALGGEEIVYPTGTRFVAPEGTKQGGGMSIMSMKKLDPRGSGGGTGDRYRLPADTVIVFPPDASGVQARQTLSAQLEIDVRPKIGEHFGRPVELPIEKTSPIASHRYAGWAIEINATVDATRRISGSTWGAFSIFLTIPIALFTGWWMYRVRKGKVLEASIIGGLLTLGAVYLGSYVQEGEALADLGANFNLSEGGIALSMAIYGFIASVLPVWMLLCPRDYLSSFLKIGTLILLVLGVIIANPVLQAPAINTVFLSGGPTVNGSIFPFVFITIMCGAISGFHALVGSGTTPKMIQKETHARTIGYGAMLIEGLVAIVALIAASALPTSHYYMMNTAWKDLPKYQQDITQLAARELPADQQDEKHVAANNQKYAKEFGAIEKQVGESLQGRTGGAVTLAVGMAEIFDGAARNILGLPRSGGGESERPESRPSAGERIDSVAEATLVRVEKLIPYWYHFAIMFEALFILTTIDTGTRVGRFLLQETLGKWVYGPFGKTNWWPGAILCTALIVGGWFYFISSNSMAAIWPMFGISNQMLAVWALAVASTALVRSGKGRYVWVTLVPMVFVAITTTTAAVLMLKGYVAAAGAAKTMAERVNPLVSATLIGAIVVCTAVILVGAVKRMSEGRRG